MVLEIIHRLIWLELFISSSVSGIRNEMTIQKQNVAIKSLQAFLYTILQCPVVRRPIRANPVLNFNPGLFISLFKSLLG